MTQATVIQKWTRADEQRLRELVGANHSNREIAEILGRRVESVKSRVSRLKLRRREYWTADADELLTKNYHQCDAKWCAEQLGRSPSAVYARASNLGLTDQPKFATDDELLAVIRELHPLGYSDAEVKDVASERYACNVDRHRVGILRRRLGLPDNTLSDRRRHRVAQKDSRAIAGSWLGFTR